MVLSKLHITVSITNVNFTTMKCEHKNCTRTATSNNLEYHSDKWLCTYHANKKVVEGRRKRKYGNRTK